MRWVAFPSAQSPKIWIGPDDKVANALQLYQPYSQKGSLAKHFISALPDQLARGLLDKVSGNSETDEMEDISSEIKEILGSARLSISFSTGTPGPHRKQTAQITEDGNVIAYAKIGKSAEARLLVEAENENLRVMGSAQLESAIIPEIAGFRKTDNYSLLCQTAAPAPRKKRQLSINNTDIQFIAELAGLDSSSIQLSDALLLPGGKNIHNLIMKASHRSWNTWRNALLYLEDNFPGQAIRSSVAHGDYAPWNTLQIVKTGEAERLYVFDWEYSCRRAPALTDLFHSLFMPARLVRRSSPQKIIRRLISLSDCPVFAHIIEQTGVAPDELPAYVMLYLMRQMARELGNESIPNQYLSDCAHSLLITESYSRERQRILVGAYACEPDKGSEPGVGWNMVKAISRNQEAWVITRKNNRESIEKELSINPNPYLHFCYTDLPVWISFWKKGGRGVRLYYYLWQFAALRAARKLHKSISFDLAHHVTFVNDYIFSFLALLPIPFIWGPLGSNPEWPARLAPNKRALCRDILRYYIQATVRCVDPLYWLCTARASLILGINKRIGSQIPLRYLAKGKFLVHESIGVERLVLENRQSPEDNKIFTILTMGQLLPIKGFRLSLLAFNHCLEKCPDARLVIVGKGPERPALEDMIKDLDISRHVTFVDWMPRHEALGMMKNADVFLYPSFEGSGMVVLEAMANGLPVVCLDFGGPGEMVKSGCGIRVTPADLQGTVSALGDSLVKLGSDPIMRKTMGVSAIQHVHTTYLWENRSGSIDAWYKHVQHARRM